MISKRKKHWKHDCLGYLAFDDDGLHFVEPQGIDETLS
jgi:hypothetical protein